MTSRYTPRHPCDTHQGNHLHQAIAYHRLARWSRCRAVLDADMRSWRGEHVLAARAKFVTFRKVVASHNQVLQPLVHQQACRSLNYKVCLIIWRHRYV